MSLVHPFQAEFESFEFNKCIQFPPDFVGYWQIVNKKTSLRTEEMVDEVTLIQVWKLQSRWMGGNWLNRQKVGNI